VWECLPTKARFCGRCGASTTAGDVRPLTATADATLPFQTLAPTTGGIPRAEDVGQAAASQWRVGGEMSVGALGEYVDGWKDVLDGMSGHAGLVAAAFEDQINQSLEHDGPQEVVNTLAHEDYHAYQEWAMDHPDVHPNPEQVEAWRENRENYVSFEEDPVLYREQPIEADAWEYGDRISARLYGGGL